MIKILITAFTTFASLFNVSSQFLTTKISPMLNDSSEKNTKTRQYYWKKNQLDWVMDYTYQKADQEEVWLFYTEILLENSLEEEFVSWSPVDIRGSSQTFSTLDHWKFYGESWRNLGHLGNQIHRVDLVENGIVPLHNILKYSTFNLQYQEFHGEGRLFFAQQWLGLSFFQRSGYPLLSVFGYQKVSVFSWDGGRLYLNLGSGIKINTSI